MYIVSFVLLSAVDDNSQQSMKHLSPADLLSFARQTAMGMVSNGSQIIVHRGDLTEESITKFPTHC
jgi:hypothetical protein